MVSYNSRTDDISIDGKRISPQRAKQIKNSIEQELELRESYLDSELYKSDMAITNRTIKILCDSNYNADEKIFVTVGFALENENVDRIFDDNIITWIDKWDTHGEFLVYESDVKEIFENSDVNFCGFNVRYADGDVTKKYQDEIESFN